MGLPWPPNQLTRRGARQASEDALVVWVGSRLWQGHYGGGWGAAAVLAFVYLGVVISDWVRTSAPTCTGTALARLQGSNVTSPRADSALLLALCYGALLAPGL